MSMYTGNIARKALNQLEEAECIMFEALYGEHPNDVDVSGFRYGENEEFWNIVANIYDGRISIIQDVHDAEDFGHYMVEQNGEVSFKNLEDYIDFNDMGYDLMHELDVVELEELDFDDVMSSRQLAEAYVKSEGGIDAISADFVSKYFDYEKCGIGEALIQGVTFRDNMAFDMEEFDASLGEELEDDLHTQEMIEER